MYVLDRCDERICVCLENIASIHCMHIAWREVKDEGIRELIYIYVYVYWRKVAAVITTWSSVSVAKCGGVRGVCAHNSQCARHDLLISNIIMW